MKKLTSFNIDISDLAATALSRQFTIGGEKDAEFILQVFDTSSPIKFYDFSSRSFSTTFTSTSSLKVKMEGNNYNGNIDFPANAGGDTYTILIIAPPDKDTELGFGQGKNSYSTTITQVPNTNLIFRLTTSNSDNYTSATLSQTATSSGSPVGTVNVLENISLPTKNIDNDGFGFGLRLIRQPIGADWYFETTEAISSNPAGDAVSNNTVIVADLTDIATGMELIYHKSTTAPSATTVITAIDKVTKIITFSTSTAFEDGETMTLRAKGSSIIKKAIGADIDFSTWNANVTSSTSAELTKIVRTDAGSTTTIDLYGTYGISGGGFVTISGANVVNTGTNTVQTVSASSGSGSIVMQVDQTGNGLAQGTKLYFEGSALNITIENNITIKSYPSSSKTIYLNLDNFITPGVSGS